MNIEVAQFAHEIKYWKIVWKTLTQMSNSMHTDRVSVQLYYAGILFFCV